MNDRIKKIRKVKDLNQEEFGKRLGVTKTAISRLEAGERNITEQMLLSICREFDINEDWLRTGEGEMFKMIPKEDEVASYVAELLDPEGNPLYEIIIDVMKTYTELDPKSQEAIKVYAMKLAENMRKRQED